ncbi:MULTISPECIES: ABC transporter permease [Sporolactobacillus]|uniref:Polyamine ABC transporter permease n=2 Tax=Sporolactobacillus TaxID=2077 RepID=A0A0U1QQ78_9BACL|nr:MULTISPECIES: ABC transporter permease subunit [Sporolactobacillus]KLI02945.1 polyamine ABC transporter permease [Sporolactobacillus inulinus CASD]BBN99870.1 ABC transporter permease [Sporolactobacillus terrae]GEB76598.1 ABC transporter permease [Sporolactobacillus inulinus]
MKYLNPNRLYHALGRRKFLEFTLFTVFLLFFYSPLMNTVMLAFANVYRVPAVIPQQFGFQWWSFILSKESLMSSIFNSFVIAIVATAVSLIICVPAAYALSRYQFRGRRVLMFSYLLTNAFPKMGLYVSMGILFYKFNLMGTFAGVIIVHIINTLMFMVWLPMGALRNIHRQQEEAARDVGATPLQVFRKVTLPMAMPGIAVASIFTFLGSLEESEGTMLVGFPQINTMATEMYGVISDYPATAGAVFALILIVPSLLILFLFRKYIKPDSVFGGVKIK